MKNRASLTLMEMLIMVLVFSLSAAICLGLFAGADRLSEETSRQDRAVILAQNAAEALKAGAEPEPAEEGLYLDIQEVPSGISGLKQAEITVFFEKEAIFTLETGWQEVAP